MLTVTEAAVRLRVSEDRVRELCRGRRFGGARLVGRVWLIPGGFSVTPGARGPKSKAKQ